MYIKKFGKNGYSNGNENLDSSKAKSFFSQFVCCSPCFLGILPEQQKTWSCFCQHESLVKIILHAFFLQRNFTNAPHL